MHFKVRCVLIFAAMFRSLRIRNILTLLVIPLFLLVSCSEYKKVMNSNDRQLKLEKAKEYYNNGDYVKARDILEELVTLYRGTKKAEDIYYYYSFCYYALGDHLMASHYFYRYTKTFPNSKKSERALFMSAYCDYMNSPEYNLDQSETKKALNKLQLFVDRYPKSTRVDSCNSLIEELRDKLEKKAYSKSKLYLKTRHYRAAIESFENTLQKYPDSQYKEEMGFLQLKAHYKLAENSIRAKKVERFENTIESYHKFAEKYPDSERMDEANEYLERSKEFLSENSQEEQNQGS